MKKLEIGLLLAGCAAPVWGDPTVGATDQTDQDEWAQIDQELVGLSALVPSDGGLTIGGYVHSHYESSDDEAFTGAPGADTGGWRFRAVRLEAKGSIGDEYDYKVSADGKNGELQLKDAYADWHVGDDFDLRWGQFKEPVSHAGLTSGSRQLFVGRTSLGGINKHRGQGVMLHGGSDLFEWAVAAQNGDDGAADEYQLTARVIYNPVGDGAFGKYQGAFGYGGETNLSFGLSWQDDGSNAGVSTSAGDYWYLETGATMDNFAVYAEISDVDDDYDGPKGGVEPLEDLVADTTPWSLTLSYLFGDDEFEAAARYENADDSADTTRVSAGLNWYSTHGHDLKWQVNFLSQESDDSSLDGNNVLIGLVFRF